MEHSTSTVKQNAAILVAAERDLRSIAPLDIDPPVASTGYRIARAARALRLASGANAVGYKIAGTAVSPAESLVAAPTYGTLFDTMQIEASSIVSLRRFIAPRIELELAFVLDRDLIGCPTGEDVLRATRLIHPAIEIIDTRILAADPATGRRKDALDGIADNASAAAFVLGNPIAPPSRDPAIQGTLYREGDQVAHGCAANVMGDPANAVAWLAAALPAGERLRAGDIILSGSFAPPFPVTGPSTFTCDFGRLGQVSVSFGP